LRSEKTLGRFMPCATPKRTAGTSNSGRLGITATSASAIA
jgi:hypothetical protein